ncbi:MAG: mannonate dehydratase [Clostridiales bacterium]|nr:mannonate dehydratase [Clostridiales bacterium]
MLLTDYFRSEPDVTWDYAKQSGVNYGVIRLPENKGFDLTDKSHWAAVHKRFTDYGITPVIVEPMPNEVHDHIKAGDALRDESIEKVLKMLPIMRGLGIGGICFNWMAHIGWLRTRSDILERGGAFVTEYDPADFTPKAGAKITEKELWDNYEYFLKAVMPVAEKYDINLALHPDDPPVPKLGDVSRIMINVDNIKKAIYDIYPSKNLGLTMCQANFYIMGADVEKTIEEFAEKIFFVHFRNTTGTLKKFRETFHDNGDLDMAKLLRLYTKLGIDVPIRVDHVPTMKGENTEVAGYAAMGRLFAIGYLKGLLEAIQGKKE